MLKRVSIQNFKSLKDVTLDLQKVNLLIGPNNSGKTNFLKALEFFDLYVDQKNEFSEQIVFNRDTSNEIIIKFSFEPEGDFSNFQHISLDRNPKDYSVRKKSTDFQIKVTQSEKLDSSEYNSASIPRDRANLMLASYIGRIIIYKPDPNKIILPGPVGLGDHILSADASNIVGFLDLMLSRYRKTAFSQIESDLQKCIAEFSEINLDDVKPSEDLVKNFGNKSFKRVGLFSKLQQITYWADELSEGTLYFLALLCIINQPIAPRLLLLEEPEKGIHPRRIREVMDFIFRLSEEKNIQVILTSHNENVLNEFTSMPEAVFVFDKDEEGATLVRNLQKDIIEPSHQRSRENRTKEIDFTENLGENWMYGLLGGVPKDAL